MKVQATCAAAMVLCISAGATQAQTTVEERARIWAIAQLVLQPGDQQAIATIRAGIKDGNPSVRVAAARVARAMGAAAVVAELRGALSGESGPQVEAEVFSAISELDSTSGSDELLLAVMNSDQDQRMGRLSSLVRARGPRLLALWSQLKTTFEDLSWTTARGLKEGLHRAAPDEFARRAIRDSMEDLYDALLFTRGLNIDPEVVIAGLASSASGIRSSAYIAAADRDLMVKEPPPVFDQPTLCERASRHLLEAARGFPRSDSFASLLSALSADPRARKCVLSRFSDARDSIRGLAPAEREALLKGIEADKEVIESAVKKSFATAMGSQGAPREGAKAGLLRTLSDHPPDFVHAVLEGTKCQGRERFFDGVDITYGEGGRIHSVLGLKSGASAEGCGTAAKVLGLTSFATGGDERVTKILPERPEFLTCLTEPDPPRRSGSPSPESGAAADDSKVKKIKGESPRFPVNASVGNAQGIVILSALVRPSGCVGGLTVLKGVHPILDLEAINAVAGWRYEPMFKNGEPVPLLVTATVNFKR